MQVAAAVTGCVAAAVLERDVHEASDDDMERMANRLALLVSDTGEADNAGRAVGALARKIGLSGGDLKAIFMTGAAGGLRSRRDMPRGTPDAAKLERELSTMRHSLTRAEVAVRGVERERAALEIERDRLKLALETRVATGRRRVIAGAFAAGVMSTVSLVLLETSFRASPANSGSLETEAAAALATPRAGRVRAAGTSLFPTPERTGAIITTLPSGTKIVVKRLFWRTLMQWAEIDALGRHGYVVTTEIDIS